jgi:hypothetical protein
MFTDPSQTAPYFPSTGEAFPIQSGDEPTDFDSSTWLMSTQPHEERGVDSDIGHDSLVPPFTKSELEAPTFLTDSLKDENDPHFLEAKPDLDPSEWLISEDWMKDVLWNGLMVSASDIRMDHDVYRVANEESAKDIFPV